MWTANCGVGLRAESDSLVPALGGRAGGRTQVEYLAAGRLKAGHPASRVALDKVRGQGRCVYRKDPSGHGYSMPI